MQFGLTKLLSVLRCSDILELYAKVNLRKISTKTNNVKSLYTILQILFQSALLQFALLFQSALGTSTYFVIQFSQRLFGYMFRFVWIRVPPFTMFGCWFSLLWF